MKYKLGFLGCGNMGKAIADGVLKSGLLTPETITMSSLIAENFRGIEVVSDNARPLEESEFLLLAVKPQSYNELKNEFKRCRARYVISIMAGIPVKRLQADFPGSVVFRVMPNTPCSIGAGMSVIADNDAPEAAKAFVEQIFCSVGAVAHLPETLFDAVTAVSGSGPAYVYYFIQAMTRGGVACGLDEATAKRLAIQTMIGSAELARLSADPLDVLIDRVCSKGGTTIQAIESFREDRLADQIVAGMEKCRRRSEELGKL